MIRLDRPWGAELAAFVIIGVVAASFGFSVMFHRQLGPWLCLVLMACVQSGGFLFAVPRPRWAMGLVSFLGLFVSDALVLARLGEFSAATGKWLLPVSVALGFIGSLIGARRGAVPGWDKP